MHSTAWCGPQSKSGRTVLREAIQKSIAGGRQAYATEKRRADTAARLTCTMRPTPLNHEEVPERLETFPMEGEDVRPAEPAPSFVVASNLVHIGGGILRGRRHRRAHALCAPAADQIPLESSRLGRCCLFQPCKRQDHLSAHPRTNSGARVDPGSRVCGPNRKVRRDLSSEPAGVWGSWSSRPRPQLSFCAGGVFVHRLVRGPGTRDFARTSLAHRAEGRGCYSYTTLARLALFYV